MDFFAHQDRARRATRWLLFYYSIAVIFVVVAINLVILPCCNFCSESDSTGALISYSLIVTSITLLLICGGSAFRMSELTSSGGAGIAQSLGGRLVPPNTTDLQERQLLNIVEEMALAAGIPVPQVYVLDEEESINAFAAGWSPETAVIGVTRGSLDYFTRDQLQGVIAHEFSHILNGDMKLNLRLIGFLFGLELIFILGLQVFRIIISSSGSRRNSEKGSGAAILAIILISLLVAVIGFIGKVMADLIRAAISRQREYLADASAVQFTRNPDGIGQALMKIGIINKDFPVQSKDAEEANHLFFSEINASSFISNLWASHPPLKKRISRILPDFNGVAPDQIRREIKELPGLRFHPDNQNGGQSGKSGKSSSRKKGKESWRNRLGNQREGQNASTISGLTSGFAVDADMNTDLNTDLNTELNTDLNTDGSTPKGASTGRGAEDLNATPWHCYTDQTLNHLDSRLKTEINDPFGVQAILCALLLDSKPEVLAQQQAILMQHLSSPLILMVQQFRPLMSRCTPSEKMILTELAVPALRLLSPGQYESLRQTLVLLTEADGRLDLLEMSLRLVLTNRLDRFFELPSSLKPRKADLTAEQLRETSATVLGFLAYEGHTSEELACQAFDAACAKNKLNLFIPDRENCRLRQFAQSIQTISGLKTQEKSRLLSAVKDCVEFDGKITPREQELLFALKAIMAI